MGPGIRVDGLGKRYRLGQSAGGVTLREAVSRAVGRLGRLPIGRNAARPDDEHIWALREITFEIEAGQVVGMVGANGSGKSTLLKILSRITEPTAGVATIYGRVGSLLEVGTGFHPELTGRENIYLNGAILGMRRSEIVRRYDEIVAFAEVERFLDTAVKHYSDGMYLRLAFAVAAHLEPDVLLVDEVLAVGDARFQRKCLGMMSSIAEREGRTVIVVSHNMGIIQRLCANSLWIHEGRLAAFGPTHDVVSRYLGHDERTSEVDQWLDVSASARRGTGEARFSRVRYTSGVAQAGYQPYPDGPITFTLEIESDAPRTVPSFGVVFADRHGTKLVNADILASGDHLILEQGTNVARLSIEQLHLNPGVYDVSLWMGDVAGEGYDFIESAFEIDVVVLEAPVLGVTPGSEHGAVTSRVSVERL